MDNLKDTLSMRKVMGTILIGQEKGKKEKHNIAAGLQLGFL